ncbi:5'/3'-nucleotidase SurE [Candidatus Heimdallarchaeota archaeon B3_Heim]|nr:MAG: 5'/3'-nucleotidase SurE [Candidatus Heimdallarchaeota archaeon B3_Heim]
MSNQQNKHPNIFLSADDGIYSKGIKSLATEMHSRRYNITVIAPRTQRSGVGKAITFEEPIRVEEIPLDYLQGAPGWRITGTPADAVIHGIYDRTQNKDQPPFDLVVAGINAGENTSVHSVLTSGTCAVAFEASILGKPAIAFSLDVHDSLFFDDRQAIAEYEIAAKIACDMIEKVVENGLPKEVAFLNVNFPDNVTLDTPIKIVRLSPTKYLDYTIKKEDPRGVAYYWIWGDRLEVPRGTDAYTVLEEKSISLSPVSLDFNCDLAKVKPNLKFLLS